MKSFPKRICLISTEIFAYGKFGGFGRATRTIGRELVKRGYEVFAIVPRRENQLPEENLDGITVLSYTAGEILGSGRLYKKVNAGIYHSCEPSYGTYLAHKNVPEAKHIATMRDPRSAYDWYLDFIHPSKSHWQVVKNYLYEANFLVRKSIRQNDGVFSICHYQISKIKKIYGLKSDPGFLPTPVQIPVSIRKSDTPNVLSMSRLDPRKRPELILSLAERFPHVQFHIAGKSRNQHYGEKLMRKYNSPNITYHGFVDQFTGDAHHRLLEEAWVLINAGAREALPNSFLEACAHQCAILSYVDPDGFAAQFGYHAAQDNFEEGLAFLLENNRWRENGMKGFHHVAREFAMEIAMDRHEEVYARLL